MAADTDAPLAAQLARMRARLEQGMPRRGWKVGINVPEVQRKLGLEHALFGWLDDERICESGATLTLAEGTRLHAEPELCLRLDAAVRPGASPAELRAAVGAVAPALEIVDYAQPAGSLAEVVQGSMFHHATVLSEFREGTPADLGIAAQVHLRAGDRELRATRTDLVPRDPADVVALLARLLQRAGEALEPGDLILSGSFTEKALPLTTGTTVRAEVGAFGTVCCHAV